jgi:apolipoprotein N-acyltransferase
MITYGTLRLEKNPTTFSNINIRLVQPSIPQVAKWDANEFWKNLDKHIDLSSEQSTPYPDLIIWSEAALVVPYKYQPIKDKLKQLLKGTGSILITGGVSDNEKHGDDFEIYTAMQAINEFDEVLFEYHKSHLVPFGEYMPFKNILPMKKITPGFLDYTQGTGGLVYIDKLNLVIKPLICYESIFSDFVKTNTQVADVIINITNDSWYGKSSGPYQHLYMSKIRAVENGLPMLRVANNGISAIIDPTGRVIQKLQLNQVGIIDGKIPNKLKSQTIYYKLLDFYQKIKAS